MFSCGYSWQIFHFSLQIILQLAASDPVTPSCMCMSPREELSWRQLWPERDTASHRRQWPYSAQFALLHLLTSPTASHSGDCRSSSSSINGRGGVVLAAVAAASVNGSPSSITHAVCHIPGQGNWLASAIPARRPTAAPISQQRAFNRRQQHSCGSTATHTDPPNIRRHDSAGVPQPHRGRDAHVEARAVHDHGQGQRRRHNSRRF